MEAPSISRSVFFKVVCLGCLANLSNVYLLETVKQLRERMLEAFL